MTKWPVVLFGIVLLASWAAGIAAAPELAVSPAESVTFNRDIAPIVYKACAPCHQPDGPAPFSLITYDEVRRHAAQIAAVTASRYMPPWKPEPGFGDFSGERRLSNAQVEVIARWVADGRLEGQRSDLPAAPHGSSGWQLGAPDLVVTLPEYTLRADGADVFRNFVVAVPGSGARYVRGMEFRPGSRAVHHANIRVDATPASRRLDDADPEPGYEGMILHSADYPDGHFLGWTPGQAPPLAADDLSWRLDAGDDLVVQLHLQPTGKLERVRPSIGLYFTQQPPARTPAIVRLGRQNLDIPAGASDYRVTDAYLLPVDAEVRAIQPHAHYRARSVSASAVLPDGTRRRADRHPSLGLQLAGPVPLRNALLASGWDNARNGIRVRQFRRERAESEPPSGARLVGLAIDRRDGGRLDPADDSGSGQTAPAWPPTRAGRWPRRMRSGARR